MNFQRNRTETILANLFDPRSKTIPVFDALDYGLGFGNGFHPGIYWELSRHFRAHYNFLRSKVGREPLAENFSDEKLLWYMLVYMRGFLGIFVDLLAQAVDKEAQKRNLVPHAFFPLEVETVHFSEHLFRQLEPFLNKDHIEIGPSKVAAAKGLEGYLDCRFRVWAQVSGDGRKVYLSQVADLLLEWFFLEFVGIVQASFSWVGFVMQSGKQHFARLIGSYGEFWDSYGHYRQEGNPPFLYEKELPLQDEFADFFTNFRLPEGGLSVPVEVLSDGEDHASYDFLSMWGGVNLLRKVFLDLLTGIYLKFFLGLAVDVVDEESKHLELVYEQHPLDLASYIWGKEKPSFFFIWDFMLDWTFSDYYGGLDFYVAGKPNNFKVSEDWETTQGISKKPKNTKLYNPSLISEEERNFLLFFIGEAKKHQGAIASSSEETRCCYDNAWPIFCFSTDSGTSFRDGEPNNINWALYNIPGNALVRPRVTQTNMWDTLLARYVLLVDPDEIGI